MEEFARTIQATAEAVAKRVGRSPDDLAVRTFAGAVIGALRLIRAERLRADIAAYQREPATEEETAWALLADTSGLADDTDWEALYSSESA